MTEKKALKELFIFETKKKKVREGTLLRRFLPAVTRVAKLLRKRRVERGYV